MSVALSHEDKDFKSSSFPPTSNSVSAKPFQITSQPYSLEEFYKKYDFPQIVRVARGYFGTREEDIISVDQELLLFFVKTSQVIVASSQTPEQYYISLNSSLQFVPYSASDTSVGNIEHCHKHIYRTVADLLDRKAELPKVVRVCKTYNGKSAQTSVVAGELIFPKIFSVLQTVSNRRTVLECLNSKKELLQLELTCEGNFSFHPMDVKMPIAKFIQYFSDFPISVIVINDCKGSSKSFSLPTGTILSLKESKTLQSYIYTIDIFGKKKYPLEELPMTVPIQIQCIEYADLDIKPIYNAIKFTYENFKPSLVKRKIFSTQHELYEEIQKDDDSTHIYNLERPSRIYDENAPKSFKSVKHTNYPYSTPVKTSSEAPPIPPPRHRLPVAAKNLYRISECHPVSSINRKLSVPVSDSSYTKITGTKESSAMFKIPVQPSRDIAFVPKTERQGNNASSVPPTSVITMHSSKQENVAYLKTLSLSSMLQLLDNMNLGVHKKSFKDELIDGEIMVHLSRQDLGDLGISKSIHQKRLLKFIDGSVSAKKYQNGGLVSANLETDL